MRKVYDFLLSLFWRKNDKPQNKTARKQRKKENAKPIDFEAKEIDDSIFSL